ncbi:MAG: GerMN domain-containing protein [Hungatella sp.]|jgi:hypothetical protein|nr:GerMN domain-containing protein [Hungatella sp.]
MKKLILCLAGAMMAFSLAACTPTEVTETTPQGGGTSQEGGTSQGEKRNPEGITPEMVAESNAAIQREADEAAPIYEMAFIYVPNSDASGLVRVQVDLEGVTEQTLVDCLIEKGVLEEETMVNSFELQGGEKVGPGMDIEDAESGERIGILDLSKIAESGTAGETVMLNSIANTFIENYELDKLKLLINGENYESGHIVHGDEDYLEFTNDYEESK